MQSSSDEGDSLKEASAVRNGENKLVNDLSRLLTKDSVAAAGINVDTPIVDAIIGNLTGKLSTKKKFAKQVKCKICNCSVSSNIVFQRHLIGAKHQKKLKHLEIFTKLKNGELNGTQKSQENQPNSFMCEICPLEVNSVIQLQNHLSGERHRRMANRMKLIETDKNQESIKSDKPGMSTHLVSTPERKMKINERGLFPCHTCNILLNSKSQQTEHMHSKKHKIKEELRQRLQHSLGKVNPHKNSNDSQKDDVLHVSSNISLKDNLIISPYLKLAKLNSVY